MGIKAFCKTVENSIFITFRNSLVGCKSQLTAQVFTPTLVLYGGVISLGFGCAQ